MSRSNNLANNQNPTTELSQVIGREAATSSLLPEEADPLQGITSDEAQANHTFDNNQKNRKNALDIQLKLKPINMSASPTKRP